MKKNKKDVACGAKGQKTTAACSLISMMNNERLHCGHVTSDSCETRGSLKRKKGWRDAVCGAGKSTWFTGEAKNEPAVLTKNGRMSNPF